MSLQLRELSHTTAKGAVATCHTGMPLRRQNGSTENTLEKKTRRCQGGLTGELAVFNQFPV
jgi:hypothetical protein